mgnify:CR=1 FL=1
MIELINKIRYLIDAKSKKYLILLSILLIIATFLEVFGLGIILPLISIIIDPDYLESNKYLLKFQSFFGNISKLSFINYLLFFIVLLYFLKSIFIVSVVFVQNKLLNNIKVLLSNKLFHRYIFSDYSFLLKHNSSILIKNIQTEVGIFQSFCSSLISLTVESFTISSIILVLLFIDPLGIIVTSFFLTLFSVILIFLLTVLFDCGWSLLNHGVADTKRLNLGNLNPIYERELTKLELHQGEGRWSVSKNGARGRGCRHK